MTFPVSLEFKYRIDPLKTVDVSFSHTNHIEIPDSVGRGKIYIAPVKPGVYLSLADYSLNDPVRFRYLTEAENPRIMGIGFCLYGYGHSKPGCLKKPFSIVSGERAFYSFPSGIEFCETIKSRRMLNLTIGIEPSFIKSCIKDFPELFPEDLGFVMDEVWQRSDRTPGIVQKLINQILSCPFGGISRTFFIEAKVMEILAVVFNESVSENLEGKKVELKPEDIEKVQKTAEIIKLNPENFKNLESISRSVGMCRSKLHKCFCLVYGMSPFEYLREFRMETAKSLLLNGKMSITEIAYSLGYSSQSHFAKTFREQVGVLPRKYKKSVKK